MLRRMTQYEYQNTMTDLLGIDFDFTTGMPPDERARTGLRNDATTMRFTTEHLQHDMDTARRALDLAIVAEKPEKVPFDVSVTDNKTAAYVSLADKSGPEAWVPFERGLLRIRIKARPLDDETHVLGVALGRVGDRLFDLRLVSLTDLRGRRAAPSSPPAGDVVLGAWHAVGPFPGGFDDALEPERNPVDLKQVFTVTDKAAGGDVQRGWVPRRDLFEGGRPRKLPVGKGNCIYLARTITCVDERSLSVEMCSQEGIRGWLNGTQVLAEGEGRSVQKPHKVAVDLRKGENQLLVKVHAKANPATLFRFACEGVAPPPEYELQEFVFDVEMANCPKPRRGTRNRPLMVTAWDANDLPFRRMLSMNDNNSGYSQPDPTGFDIESFEVEGPVTDPWPPTSHARIFGAPPADGDETVHAREILFRFMRRAWRRPIAKAELGAMVQLYEGQRAGLGFVAAVRETLVAVLTSPSFIFLVEPAAESKPVPLTDHELATRLSYFLWSTMPDEKLSGLADSGMLRNPAVLRRTVAEMLRDARVANFVRHFTLQWLKLDTVEKVAVDNGIYQGYQPDLATDMVEETVEMRGHFLLIGPDKT